MGMVYWVGFNFLIHIYLCFGVFFRVLFLFPVFLEVGVLAFLCTKCLQLENFFVILRS